MAGGKEMTTNTLVINGNYNRDPHLDNVKTLLDFGNLSLKQDIFINPPAQGSGSYADEEAEKL